MTDKLRENWVLSVVLTIILGLSGWVLYNTHYLKAEMIQAKSLISLNDKSSTEKDFALASDFNLKLKSLGDNLNSHKAEDTHMKLTDKLNVFVLRQEYVGDREDLNYRLDRIEVKLDEALGNKIKNN